MTRDQFNEAMIPLTEIFTEGLNENQVDIYFEILKDCDFERMKLTVMKVLKTYTYPTFPKPGYIYQSYEETDMPIWTDEKLAKYGIKALK